MLFFSTGFTLEEDSLSSKIQNKSSSGQKNYDPVFPIEDIIDQPPQQNDKFYAEFINMLASLGLIIALIFIVAWFLKRLANTRLTQANSTSVIRIIEKRVISPKTALYLLEIEGTGLLIAESVSGVTRLSEFPLEALDSQKTSKSQPVSASLPSSFEKLLDR